MQSLPLPPPQLLAKPTNTARERDEPAPAGPRVDDSFAQRLQQRKPEQKTEQKSSDDRTTVAPRRAPADDAPDPETVVPEGIASVPVVVPDEPAPLTPALADTLLTLISTTNAAVAAAANGETTEKDPLLAALNALLAGLPTAQPGTSAAQPQAVEVTPIPSELTDAAPEAPALAVALAAAQAALATQAATTTNGQNSTPVVSKELAPGTARPITDAPAKSGELTTAAEFTSPSTPLAANQAAPTKDAPTEGDLGAQAKAFNEGIAAAADDKPDDGASFADSAAKLPPAGPVATHPRAEITAAAKQAPVDAGNPMERVVAQQVSRALIHQSADGNRMISLRLTPPELGTVRIDIIERGGVLTARIHAEDAAVRTAIERYLPQLRQELTAHNAPVSELHLADGWAGDLTRQPRDNASGGRSSNRRNTASSGFSLDGLAPLGTSLAPTLPTSLGGSIAADRVDARA